MPLGLSWAAFVKQERYKRVETPGDLFCRDRMCIHTVAVSFFMSRRISNLLYLSHA